MLRLKTLSVAECRGDLLALPEGKMLINTINAHSYNIAQTDALFAEALTRGDVLIPDGVSIVKACKLLQAASQPKERIAGWDLFVLEMDKLNEKGGKCFFMGSSKEVLGLIKTRASVDYPNIVVETYSPPYKQEFSTEDNGTIIDAINAANPDLLWIGMTAPKQEKWAYAHLDKLNVNCHIGTIGAVFDFYAGTVERAPLWWQRHGLEWLHRLVQEPKRMWRRYLVGNFLFVRYILKEKMSNDGDETKSNAQGKTKIAFVSTRGIPNDYGGFEQFAEYVSVGLAKRGYDVSVYSPKYHPYKKDTYKGVRIKHIYSPERWMGSSVGSFFYDFVSFRDALKNERCDIIYDAGYTSIIPAYVWFDVKRRKHPIVVTNMDGMESRRMKFSLLARRFLEWEEKMAVKHSHHLVADNEGIRDYYKKKYGVEGTYLAYGADIHDNYSEEYLKEYGLETGNYYLLIARLERENNVAMTIDGYLRSKENGRRPLVIVGRTNTPYGKDLLTKYGKDLLTKYGEEESVRFLGGIYDFDKINSIRRFSCAYFHGHSVGGTNPSLLEAMASGCFVLAHDNVFNRAVLGDNALYYSAPENITEMLNDIDTISVRYRSDFIAGNLEKIRTEYSWERITDKYEAFFSCLLEQSV